MGCAGWKQKSHKPSDMAIRRWSYCWCFPYELARRQTHWRGNGKLHRKPIVVRKYRQTSFGNVTRRMIGLFSCTSLSPARCICSLKVCVCFLVSPRGNKPWPGFAVAFFDGLAYCVLCKHNLSARTLAHRTDFQNSPPALSGTGHTLLDDRR